MSVNPGVCEVCMCVNVCYFLHFRPCELLVLHLVSVSVVMGQSLGARGGKR